MIVRFFDKLFKRNWFRQKQNIATQDIENQEIGQIQSLITCKSIKRGFVSTYKIQSHDDAIKSLKKRYIAFDVETTGLNPKEDRIIEVGAVLFENGEITKRYGTLIDVGVLIPSAATAINHITNDMVKGAPKEEEVYSSLVQFLGDAMDGQIILCAHNAKFDMGFLSETLMRLGYDGEICYVDTLDLSRKLVKGLQNYKQDTVASHFGIINEQVHRAFSDAEVCGKILWALLELKDEEQEQRRQYIEKSKLSDEEREVCAYIQDIILKNGDDTELLGFIKNSSNYVDVRYVYSILKFKFGKKRKYIIVEKNALKNLDFDSESCTLSEGGVDYSRVYFDSPFELDPLSAYIFEAYKKCRKSALDYFKYHKRYEEEAKSSMAMLNTLSPLEVESLLLVAQKRRSGTDNPNKKPKSRENFVTRDDITITPVHNRIHLNSIRNLDDWSKGFDDGYQYWEQGDKLRKAGDIEAAISLFDKARYNGYCAPVLFESYAMVYHKLKDYDNEIDILDEGIERIKKDGTNVGKLEARRNKAVQLLYKQQEEQKKILQKQQKVQGKAKEKKVTTEVPKRSKGRAVLQLSDDLSVINKYETIAEAVRKTGINSKSIRDAAKGVQKHAGGYVWRYIDGDEESSF